MINKCIAKNKDLFFKCFEAQMCSNFRMNNVHIGNILICSIQHLTSRWWCNPKKCHHTSTTAKTTFLVILFWQTLSFWSIPFRCRNYNSNNNINDNMVHKLWDFFFFRRENFTQDNQTEALRRNRQLIHLIKIHQAAERLHRVYIFICMQVSLLGCAGWDSLRLQFTRAAWTEVLIASCGQNPPF